MDNRFSAPYSHPRWWFEGSYTPSCFDCAHFRGAQKGKMVCLAFPDGIPLQLTKRGVIHDTPYPGDHGIQYEKYLGCLLYTSPSPRDYAASRMPSSA